MARPTCGECGGYGTLVVDEDYVRRHLVEQGRLGIETRPPRPGHAEALRNSVVPCHACQPRQYELWREGHYVPNHVCSTCRPPTRNKSRNG